MYLVSFVLELFQLYQQKLKKEEEENKTIGRLDAQMVGWLVAM